MEYHSQRSPDTWVKPGDSTLKQNKPDTNTKTNRMSLFTSGTQSSQAPRDRLRNGSCQGSGRGWNGELMSNGHRVSFCQMNTFWKLLVQQCVSTYCH